jgi:fibronectin type 3 domain-containing protein
VVEAAIKPAAFFNVMLADHTARLKEAYMKKLSAGFAALLLFVSLVVSGCDGVLTEKQKGSLPTPSGLEVTGATSTTISLEWGSVGVASGYRLYRSSSSGGQYSQCYSGSNSYYTDSGLSPDTPYYYKVSAYSDYSDSSRSEAVPGATLLAPPTGLTATAVSSTKIDLSWTAVGSSYYNVYRSTNPTGTYTLLTQGGWSSANYSDESIYSTTTYYYKVAVRISNSAEGERSDYASVSNTDAPANLTATAISTSQIDLSWSASSSSSSYYYNVYRSTSATGTYELLTSSGQSSTTYSDYDVTSPDTTYYYKVSTRNYSSGVAGAQSAYVSAAIISAPTGLTATTVSTTKIDLSWTAVGSSSYNVYRSTSSTGTYTLLTPDGWTSASYSDEDIYSYSTTTYYYKVAVRNSDGAAGIHSTYAAAATNGAPTGLTATVYSTSQIDLSWNSTGSGYYYVYRSDSATGTYELQTPYGQSYTTYYSTYYNDTGLDSNTSYYYKVAVQNSSGGVAGAQSAPVSAATISAPLGLTATAVSTNQISLSWSPVGSSGYYNVYRSTSDTGTYTLITEDGVLGSSYSDTSVTGSNSTYYYKVAARNSDGAGMYSTSAAAATNSAPTGLTATTYSTSQINLSWNPVSSSNVSYYVYRSDSATGTYERQNSSSGQSYTYYYDTGLTSDKTYYYKIAVRNTSSGVAGVQSEPVSAATISAPENLTATAISAFQIDLSWEPLSSSGVSSYNVYRSINDSTGTYTLLTEDGLEETYYSDDDFSYGSSFYYRVAARNSDGGEGMYSSASATNTSAPTGLTATTSSATQIDLSWTPTSGANGYNIYRSTSEAGPYKFLSATGYNGTYSDYDSFSSDTTYYYTIAVRSSTGSTTGVGTAGIQSDPVPASTIVAPTNLFVKSATSSKFSISWNAVTGAIGYNVYRRDGSSSSAVYELLPPGGSSTDPVIYDDNSTFYSSTTYYYKVAALNSDGAAGIQSTAANAAIIAAPTSISSSVSGSDIILSWYRPNNGYYYYRVYCSYDGGTTYEPIHTTSGTSSSSAITYTDSSLNAGTYYYYVVAMTSDNGTEGERSNTFSNTVP